jgi:hypothetical protein
MNAKLAAVWESQGHPLDLFVIAGQVSDCFGARAVLSNLPTGDQEWRLTGIGAVVALPLSTPRNHCFAARSRPETRTLCAPADPFVVPYGHANA